MSPSDTQVSDFGTSPEPERELQAYQNNLRKIQDQIFQLRNIRTLSSQDVFRSAQELDTLIVQMTKENVLRPTDAAYISIMDARRELNIVLDLFDALEEGYSNATKGTLTEATKHLKKCQDYLIEAIDTMVPVSLSIQPSAEVQQTDQQSQSEPSEVQANEVIELATKYSKQIKKARNLVQRIGRIFSVEGKIQPTQCEQAMDELRKLSEPVKKLYGLLDVATYLMLDSRYKILSLLHHVDDLISDLTALIAALQEGSSRVQKKISSQPEIRQKLDSLLQTLDNVNISFNQLVSSGRAMSRSPIEASIVATELLQTQQNPSHPIVETSVDRPADLFDSTNVGRNRLLQAMSRVYDLSNFEKLCEDLNVKYTTLRGGSLKTKLLYLIDDSVRHQTYEKVVQRVLEDHPNIVDKL